MKNLITQKEISNAISKSKNGVRTGFSIYETMAIRLSTYYSVKEIQELITDDSFLASLEKHETMMTMKDFQNVDMEEVVEWLNDNKDDILIRLEGYTPDELYFSVDRKDEIRLADDVDFVADDNDTIDWLNFWYILK